MCLGDAVCAIIVMANGTYSLLDLHSHDIMGFQNDKVAAVFPSKREIINIFTHASSTVRCNKAKSLYQHIVK